MTTTYNCPQWTQNQKGQPSWEIAQGVGQICNKTYAVSLTDFQESLYIPNATSVNGCTCSWSMYNLLSVCSYCLGQNQSTSWSSWTANCGNNTSTTSYLPSGYTYPEGIPFWAATNPSTWPNGVFDITQAADIGGEGKPDLYGGPLPTSTTTTTETSTSTASSSSSAPTGKVIGGVIAGVVVIVIGLFIFWVVRRQRHKKKHAISIGVPSFTTHTAPQPTLFGNAYTNSPYLASPVHSTTSLEPTSLTSPISSGFSSNEHRVQPITDAADIITPFLATPSMHRKTRSNTSLQKGKVSDSVSEGRMSPLPARARMNPPSYSDSMEVGSSTSAGGGATTQARRSSGNTHNKQNSSMSGATTYSAHSQTSTWESGQTGTRTEQSRSHATTPVMGTTRATESASTTVGVGRTHGDRKTGAISRTRTPAV